MRRLLLLFLTLCFLLLSAATVSAATSYAYWGTNSNTQSITIIDGESATFDWYAYTTYRSTFTARVKLYNDMLPLHTFVNAQTTSNYAGGTHTVTPAMYGGPGSYEVSVYANEGVWPDEHVITLVVQPQPNQPPVADFSFSPANPLTGQSVQFTDLSSDADGSIISHSWSFGDGASSSQANPTHAYATTGTKSVTLTVTDDAGATASVTKPVPVSNSVPVVTVTASPESGDAPLTVLFTCDVSDGDAPFSFAWVFGDGASSTLQNPTHEYTSAGDYTATCTVTDVNGDVASDDVEVVALVPNQDPVANFSFSPASPLTGESVSFTDLSTDSDGVIVSWSWSFGDGVTSSLQNPTHTFAQTGDYEVSLTVTDDAGATASVTKPVPVSNSVPVVTATATPSVGFVPLSVLFTCDVSDGDAPFSYVWSFGDGASSTSQNPTHEYTVVEDYTATCTVTDVNGDVASDAVEVVVSELPNVAPVANFTYSPASPLEGRSVSFTDLSTDSDGAIVSWSWSFADGSTSVQQNPQHVFATAGQYDVSLTVTDNDGAANTATKTVVVQNVAPLVDVSATPSAGFVPLDVAFVCDVSSGNAPFEYVWSIDGASVSSVASFSYTFDTVGTHQATCTVTDSDGDVASDAVEVVVSELPNVAPVANFTYSPASPLEGQSVSFTDLSTDSDGAIVSWSWSFGDGSTSTLQDPSHVFTHAGHYDVSLTVTDDDGATDTLSKTVVVGNDPILAVKVVTNTTSGVAPLPVVFECIATGGNAPLSFSWDFDDGASASGAVVLHTYAAAGTYTPECVVTDADGDTGSDVIGIVVSVPNVAPVADFSFSPASPLTGQSVQFTDLSSDADGSIVSYSWVFGDGATSTLQNPLHTFSQVGHYDVSLTVTDSDGAQATANKTVIVTNSVAVVTVSADPTSGTVPLSVAFTCAVSGGDAPFDYLWSFGDGTFSTLQNPVHEYVQTGSHTAKCTVTDVNGDEASDTIVISVSEVPNKKPLANFTYVPASPFEGESVSFTDLSTDSDGVIVSWSWSFGDGSSSDQQDPTHSYTFSGTYVVSLTVTDDDGATATATKSIIVKDDPILSVDINASTDYGVAPLTVAFICTVSGGTAPFVYDWSFGDGSSATGSHTSHTYTQPGVYTIRCLATDVDGDSASDYVDVTVVAANQAPVADFSFSPASPFEGESVSFTDLSTDSDGAIVSWSWSFGDGSVSDAQHPSHVFVHAGHYDVSLTVTDDDGATATATKSIIVKDVPVLSVDINASTDYGVAPLSVDFVCTATGGNAPYTYDWSFGDGNVATGRQVSHTYEQSGIYTISCMVTDAQGASASAYVDVTVVAANQPPVADFVYTPTAPLTGDVVTFDASSSFDIDGFISSYEWDLDADGVVDDTGVEVLRDFPSDGAYPITLTVTDDDGLTDTLSKTVVVGKRPFIVIDEFGCNPDVVRGHIERCTIHVLDGQGDDLVDARITMEYVDPQAVDGVAFGTCTTNFKGYCFVDTIVDYPAGFYTVEATARKAGYDAPTPLRDTFQVWEKRYEIKNLEVFAKDTFTTPEDTFYRAEDMYASFTIYDLLSEEYVCDDALVREVFLRVHNEEPLPFEEWEELQQVALIEPTLFKKALSSVGLFDSVCEYRYWLPRIPISDDYLGQGRVFAFAFNFTDSTAGQASKVVTILNNPVSIDLPEEFVIYKHSPADVGRLTINLKEFVDDVETLPGNMLFDASVSAHDESSGALELVELGPGVIELIATSGFDATGTLTVTVDDTDGSTDTHSALVRVDVAFYPQAPVAIAGPDQSVLVDEEFTLDGSASYDPDGGDLVSYEWLLSDNRKFSGETISLSFDELGTFTAQLTVTDDEGAQDTDVATITVGKRPFVPQCSDGFDNDGDGYVDMDDPNCDSPTDNSEFGPVSTGAESGLRIMGISTYSPWGYETIVPGDFVTVEVALENHAGVDLEDLRVGFKVPYLGVKQKSYQFDIDEDDRTTVVMQVYIPYDAWPDEYYTEITVSNTDLRRSTHRMLEVVEE